jgi:sugar fermentation stimulation protein A
MRFQTPLIPATLIRRYKRFLADVVLESDGREVTAHCPNPGAMLGLADKGMRVWIEPNDDPKKKLKFGWRLVELDGAMVGIDTAVPNRVVGEALRAGSVAETAKYSTVKPEVKYGQGSRVDFLLSQEGSQDLYLEVKNVHLRRNGDLAEFPDCVTARGAKHLDELSDMVSEGHRAMMFYLIQRTDCAGFALARDLDPDYGAAFDRARAAGVEVICYDTVITTDGVTLGRPISILE